VISAEFIVTQVSELTLYMSRLGHAFMVNERMPWSNHLLTGLSALALATALIAAGPIARAAPPGPGLPDIELLNRVTWGANESALAKLRPLGAKRWLDWQLHPTDADRLPPAAQAEIDAMTISQQPMTGAGE
jgi:hypothetical protein